MGKHSERHQKLLRSVTLADGKGDLRSLSEQLGVSTKTVRRDIEELRGLGIPIEQRTSEHGRKTYYLAPDALPLKFTFDEVTSMLWCMENFRALEGTTWGESLERAEEKLRSALQPRDRHYVNRMQSRMHRTAVGGDYGQRTEVIEALSLGVEDCRATFITYHSARSTEPVTYDIHPYALVEHRGTLYVVGFSCHHDQIRTWKVDRMHGAEVTEVPFARPTDFDAKAYFRDAFAVVTGSQQVLVRVHFSGSAVRYVQEKRMHHSQNTTILESGNAEVTFRLTSTLEIKSWILSFGSSAEVIEPESLRQEVIEELQTALTTYQHNQKPSKTRSGQALK